MPIEVKICGLRSAEMLDATIEAGAAYGGLVFEPRSVRDIGIDQARLMTEHNGGRIKMVALMVNPEDEMLKLVCQRVKPDMIQLHGDESAERVAAVRRQTGLPVIKAIGVRHREDAKKAHIYEDVADLILFDTKLSEDKGNSLRGGSGQAFDWHLVKDIQSEPFMLAGGLRAENVASAIARSGAQMVDVSSGVEHSPGKKDAGLIRDFIAAAQDGA